MAYLEAIAKTTALPLTSELWSDQHRNRAKPKNGNSVQQLFNPILNELTNGIDWTGDSQPGTQKELVHNCTMGYCCGLRCYAMYAA